MKEIGDRMTKLKHAPFNPQDLRGVEEELYKAVIAANWKFDYFRTEDGFLSMESDSVGVVIVVEKATSGCVITKMYPGGATWQYSSVNDFVENIKWWAEKLAAERCREVRDLFNLPPSYT